MPAKTDLESSPDFNMGLVFRAGNIEIMFKDSELINELAFMILALKVDYELSDYVKLGAMAGYQQNHFNNPVDATTLPLSLRLEDEKSNSMMFGLSLETIPFSIDHFALNLNFQFNYFKSFLKEWDIDLPIENGIAKTRNSFFSSRIDMLLSYDGFSSFTPFIGPNLHFVSGKLRFEETIAGLDVSEEQEYQQNSLVGLSCGAKFEVGDHFDLTLRLNLFSEKSLYFTATYIF